MTRRTTSEEMDPATSVPEGTRVRSTQLITYFWALTVIWTIIVIGLLVLDFLQIEWVQHEMAKTEARANFNKDQAFRFWASKHGGVYVPINSRTPQNPFLSHVPERDITTESGKALTLMNPAYMLRQMMEEYEDLFGVRGHITSLKHFRSETAPDEWERSALMAFERGDKEAIEFTEIEGKPCLRLMRPMIAKKSCLKCHAKQGYKVGDVRGGVSISVPMTLYVTNQRKVFTTHALALGLVWLFGIAGISVATRGLRNRIKERDRAEQALRESEDKYRNVVESGSDGICIIQNTIVKFVNAQLAKMMGANKEEFLNKPFFNYVHADELPKLMKSHERFISGEETKQRYETVLVDKSGSYLNVEFNITETFFDNKKAALVMIRDITETRRLQVQLLEAQKTEAIVTLAGGIAHKFNNALTPIIGNIDLLELEHSNNENTIKSLKDMKASGFHMANLTSQLLAYARGGKYNPQVLSLNGFVELTLPLIQHTLDPAVRVETDLPLDVMNVKADGTQMQMVLFAIMANSNEAMEGPGRIRISTRNMDFDQELIKDYRGLKTGPHVCLSVKDDGKGMDEETRRRIFDPFFTTHFMGRGLGMAAVYGIIKNHDGAITLDSELGKGTKVHIYLPAIEAEKKVKKKTVSRPDLQLPKGDATILVIEDEEDVMMLIRQVLEMLGYRVLQAETGKKAIRLAKTFDGQIDLAILDIKLPDMTGDKVYPLIMAARPDLKVIVCSGYIIEGPPQDILDAGAEGFIQKPFSISTFAEKLKEVLEGK